MNITGFLLASVLLTLLPGPDILFVVVQSATQGVKRGIIFALGLCSGLVVHTSVVALGLAVVIANSPIVFLGIKLGGALYLIYLGVISLKELNSSVFETSTESRGMVRKLYFRGVMMNLLNPKVTLFFLAFLPQFVEAGSKNIEWKLFLLGLVFIAQAISVFGIVALISSRLSEKFLLRESFSKYINIFKVLMFIGLGVWILIESLL